MSLSIKLLLLSILGIIAIFLFKRLIFAIYNLMDLFNKDIRTDVTRQRNGMVFNKKTKQLEADQSIILPFK
jgi:hypothetical protein